MRNVRQKNTNSSQKGLEPDELWLNPANRHEAEAQHVKLPSSIEMSCDGSTFGLSVASFIWRCHF